MTLKKSVNSDENHPDRRLVCACVCVRERENAFWNKLHYYIYVYIYTYIMADYKPLMPKVTSIYVLFNLYVSYFVMEALFLT